jgi:hypothetical protein
MATVYPQVGNLNFSAKQFDRVFDTTKDIFPRARMFFMKEGEFVFKKSSNEQTEIFRQDLLDQLERNGTVGSYYNDMVEDWLTYWRAKQELTEDIKNRGSKVTKLDSRGQKQIVNNESIEIMIKMNVQMQKTLEFLGLKPPEMGSERSDQDEEM